MVPGVVTKLVTFGAFARIEGPVEGLIHVSELVDRRIAHPKEVVREGDLLPLKIVRIERERHRLGLSLREARDEGEGMGFRFSDGGEVIEVPADIREEFEQREGVTASARSADEPRDLAVDGVDADDAAEPENLDERLSEPRAGAAIAEDAEVNAALDDVGDGSASVVDEDAPALADASADVAASVETDEAPASEPSADADVPSAETEESTADAGASSAETEAPTAESEEPTA